MERFILEHLPTLRPSAARRYRTSARMLHPHFQGLWLDQITRGRLSTYITTRRRGGASSATLRRDLACLSSMIQLAIAWDWCDANPVKALDKRQIKESEPRRRYLSEAEYDALLGAASDYLRPMIVFSVEPGLRLEEQLSMEWNQVNLTRGELFLPRTKSGTPRTVPLSTAAAELLPRHPRHLHSTYVFCKKDGSRYSKVTRGLAGAAKRAGISDLRWHDLRRTCGSWMIQRGVDVFRVSRFLGHKSVAVTERSYGFLRAEDLHEAVRVGTKTGTGSADSTQA